ncbi:hypothetical protein LIER_22697 [Lithospermum erythrorhizon]|uniref:Bifunctional inhibitor/plant lipid transfer protein/seed storage helical domain-containing protein n=1 Tax=Lithospermum erythrorhizon TaxID=34254 RepID=A0AAV3QUT4_LITER
MKKSISVSTVCLMIIRLGFSNEAKVSNAACNAGSLSPCLSAIQNGGAPSGTCCKNLKAQQGCLCQFARDPNVSKYVNSSNARKVASSCGVRIPRC